MGWSGGTFSRAHDWTDDEAAGENIEASRMDTEDDNLAAGINACIHKGGQNAATADLAMGGNKHTNVGDASARTHYPSVGQLQDGGLVYATSSAGNAYTLTLAPVITAYAEGQSFVFKAGGTNGGAATLNVNSVGAKNIFLSGAALAGGEITSGNIYVVTYDGTQFQLLEYGDDGVLACEVTKSGNQTLSHDTATDLTWDTETYDYGGIHSTSSNTERFVPPVNGIYHAGCYVQWQAHQIGGRFLGIRVGAADYKSRKYDILTDNVGAGEYWWQSVTADLYLTTSDYVVFWALQSSGGDLAVRSSQTGGYISLVKKVTV